MLAAETLFVIQLGLLAPADVGVVQALRREHRLVIRVRRIG
jgi:hypothetical protein